MKICECVYDPEADLPEGALVINCADVEHAEITVTTQDAQSPTKLVVIEADKMFVIEMESESFFATLVAHIRLFYGREAQLEAVLRQWHTVITNMQNTSANFLLKLDSSNTPPMEGSLQIVRPQGSWVGDLLRRASQEESAESESLAGLGPHGTQSVRDADVSLDGLLSDMRKTSVDDPDFGENLRTSTRRRPIRGTGAGEDGGLG